MPYLLQWYDYNRRILPWREDPTPYHVWVSEIMLQQTRVEAVKGYYDRFLTRLPDVAALAAAEEEELLKLWEGLGYYNRVRNMQKAAQVIMGEYGGEMPADYEKLRALPGVGDYTAGAISSIAFGLPYPAVDGNVLRVMSRIACSEEDIAKEQTKRKLKEDLTSVMPARSGDFNQSLMELGAMVCLPNGKPLCEQCPVMHLCKAFHAERETELPIKSGKKERRIEKRVVYLVFCDGKVLLHRREKKGLLAGLWEFPNVLTEEAGKKLRKVTPATVAEELCTEFAKERDAGTEKPKLTVKKAKKAKHIFSHVEWHMEGVRIEAQTAEGGLGGHLLEVMKRVCETKGAEEESNNWVFVTPQELEEKYPMPSAFEVYYKEVCDENRNRL
ncbi:MAG: A/G-specific adenine glycosylase [Lachnospiraceae bacterium]|nr:A/G-specific adenine glycosylase [Lachnospiraceae bacterium]